jgi:hypothetical protein
MSAVVQLTFDAPDRGHVPGTLALNFIVILYKGETADSKNLT